jgi:sigma-E factor negative regulatory protein RseC
MSDPENVYHTGSIIKISGSQAEVKIIQQSACGKCHAKSMCAMSDIKEKVVDVTLPQIHSFSEGQTVVVVLGRKLGSKAVVLAYFLPFVLLMMTLLVMYNVTKNELVAGLSALAIMVPYYLILSLFKKKFKKEYEFRLQA